MPKCTDKTKGAQKRRKPPNNSADTTGVNDVGEAGIPPKQKKKPNKQKKCLDDGIAMSKQLASKLKNIRATRPTRPGAKESAPRLCGNGKPMPSLADLEKMYEDSEDTDTEDKPAGTTLSTQQQSERCTTPVSKIPALSPEKIMSPTTLKHIASKVITILDTITIDDDGPPHEGICPPKKQKKPDQPYIVGCKDRPRIPDHPFNSKVGVGDKYGIECHCGEEEEDECCKSKKCKRRMGGPKISKSRFNPKAEEIASSLKRNERQEKVFNGFQNLMRDGRSKSKSPDSCDTVDYEYTDNTRPFSPLPSTSRDRETILKNDKLFNESLVCDNSCSNSNSNEVEIVEVPLETVVVDDVSNTLNTQPPMKTELDDDSCMFVDTGIKNKHITLIDLDDPKYEFYNKIDTFDLDNTYTNDNDNNEIIDVDELISQTNLVLTKYKKHDVNNVTFVDPNTTAPSPVKEAEHNLENEVLISSSAVTGPLSLDAPLTQTTNNVQNANKPVTATTNAANINDSSNTIADVVTNFFSNPNQAVSRRRSPVFLESIDLTTSSFIENITSWISSVDNLIRGLGHSTPQQTPNDSVIVVNSRNIESARTTARNRQAAKPVKQTNPVVVNHTHVAPLNNPIITPATNTVSTGNRPNARTIECPICMDTLSTSIASTMCGHVFCMECIKAAIKANGKRCPTCRKKLTGAGYHQLFL